RPHMASPALYLGSRLATDEGHVRFDSLSATAERRCGCYRRLHDLANAMRKKKGGLHAAFECPLNLSRADAFLAGNEKMDRLEPQVQREMAVLEDAADPHREGLPA